MHIKIQTTWQLINVELKQNLLEIEKTVAGVTKMSDKSIKSTLHHGRKEETDEAENEIVDWILMNRSLGISVSSWEVIIKACSLNNTLKFKKIKNLQKWCYKFLT